MEKRNYPIFCTLFYFLLLLNILSSKMAAAQIIPVKVGVVLEMDKYGEMVFTCLSMALSEFYASHPHYKTRLLLITRHSKGDVVGAAAAALDLLKNVEVQAILGPTFSVQANFLISLGDRAQVPIISYSATSPSLSSIRSPYFIRTTLSDASQVKAIAAIVKAFGWREVVPVYEDNEFGEGIMPYLSDALEEVNARIPYRSVIPPLATDDQIEAELYKLMTKQTRVFIVHVMGTLASRLFTKAQEIGLMGPEYAWIVTNGITNDFHSLDPSVVESMFGCVGVRHHIPRTKELRAFEVRYKKQADNGGSKVVAADLDIYGLWAYDSAVALAIAAEKAGLTNNTLRYRHRSIMLLNSTDPEEFGVSDAGPKLIKALSSTTFKGLAGEFKLVDGQLQAPPLEIVNFIGQGARAIGYWTKDNVIVRELNSESDTTNTDSASKLKIIWPGHKSSPPKGWEIPTNRKKLRVGIPIKAGFLEFVRVTRSPNNSTKVEGYCIDVFEAVMAALPYGVPYEYIPFADENHSMAGNYNDLIYQVYLGKYDIVAGDVTIVANRSQYVDFSLPYTESGVAMVVPLRDDKSKNAWVFVKPLSWQLWLASFFSFVAIGLLIWIFELEKNEFFSKEEFTRAHFVYKFWMVLCWSLSTMALAPDKVTKNASKVVLMTWFVGFVVLTHSYTASLASMLTAQKLQPTVTDVKFLIRNKEIKVGYMKGSFVFGLLKRMNFDESRLVEYDSPEKLDELLFNGTEKGVICAAFHEIPYIKLFLGKYCNKYTMIGPITKADGFGIVFPIGSPLVNDVSRAILNVMESQNMAEIEKKWLGDMKKCSDIDQFTFPTNLGLGSFWGLFLICGSVVVATLMIHMITLRPECVRVQRRAEVAPPDDARGGPRGEVVNVPAPPN